jgi:hypothetical protein
MNRKPLVFGLLAAVALGIFAVPQEASARRRDRCDDGYRSARYRDRDYGYRRVDRYDYKPRRSYYSDYGYRSSRYRDDCDDGYYRSRRTVVYRPSYSYTSSGRYGCGSCGERFGSTQWLTYHRRHSGCG